MRQLIDATHHAPVYIQNGRLDAVATDRLGAALFSEMFVLPQRPVNARTSTSPERPRSTGIASCASLVTMWSAYADDDPSRPVEPSDDALPGLAPRPPAGLDPVELVVDGECFVVTRRPGSPGTYDFRWATHPQSYGFTVGANSEWRPDRDELTEEIRSFLSQVDQGSGYLPD